MTIRAEVLEAMAEELEADCNAEVALDAALAVLRKAGYVRFIPLAELAHEESSTRAHPEYADLLDPPTECDGSGECQASTHIAGCYRSSRIPPTEETL